MSWVEVLEPRGDLSMKEAVLGMPVKVKINKIMIQCKPVTILVPFQMVFVNESKIHVVHFCVLRILDLHIIVPTCADNFS